MRGRIEESRIKFWILTRMNRWVLTVSLLVVMFVLLIGLSQLDPTPMRRVVESDDGIWQIFSAMITAIITVVALVVTVNQLVLSQELGALGDQRERMQESLEFQRDVEPWISPSVTPPEPTAFLQALLDAVLAIAEELQSKNPGDTSAENPVDTFADDLATNARSVRDSLDGSQFGTFEVIDAALDFNYSMKIYEARSLLGESEHDLDEATRQQLTDLVTVLAFIGVIREHFKTLYFQWELVDLSRMILYASVPALTVALGMLLYVDPSAISGATLGVDNLVWLVCAAATVALAPFFILFAYVLRITTVAKRTLAIGPFILRTTDASGDSGTGDRSI